MGESKNSIRARKAHIKKIKKELIDVMKQNHFYIPFEKKQGVE